MAESLFFQQALNKLGLALTVEQQSKLLIYLELLQKWNQSYNLTAITQWDEMISHHLLDSLSLAPFVHGPRLLDVGTGAGFPGIPLAVLFPTFDFVLLDSNSKKLRFITQAISQLNITNVRLIHSRVESFDDSLGFNDIMARAVSSLAEFTNLSAHLLAPEGQWLAMKGVYPIDELKEIRKAYKVEKIDVPGLLAERHLVIIKE